MLEAALRRAARPVSIWPENEAALSAFLAGASQWRTGITVEDGRVKTLFVGLDYAGVKVAAEAAEIALDPSTFAGLQIIEAAARDALNGER